MVNWINNILVPKQKGKTFLGSKLNDIFYVHLICVKFLAGLTKAGGFVLLTYGSRGKFNIVFDKVHK